MGWGRLLKTYPLANLGHVASSEYLQVGLQGARLQDFVVFVSDQGLLKQDVVPNGKVLDPGLLRHVGDGALWVSMHSFELRSRGKNKTRIIYIYIGRVSCRISLFLGGGMENLSKEN